jgi:hypothetical protein
VQSSRPATGMEQVYPPLHNVEPAQAQEAVPPHAVGRATQANVGSGTQQAPLNVLPGGHDPPSSGRLHGPPPCSRTQTSVDAHVAPPQDSATASFADAASAED